MWPGDQPFKQEWTLRKEEGASVNLSSVCMSLHTATHADAPLHVRSGGVSIADLALEAFLGPAYVLDLTEHTTIDGFIQPTHLERVPSECTRVLLKTRHSLVPTTAWDANWQSISPAAVEWFAQRSVMLIGTDAPSVDPENSKTLDTHHALAGAGIVHLEHLWLREVPEGTYTLAALPLNIAGADAAPVRAVLYTES
ncbi:MAG: kynurenine formamidase [Bacteroidetes bacterium]|nr:kynurenine formamidase [Bacteroidota bacterium]